jgi:predicted AAA+ superfamily ATPase
VLDVTPKTFNHANTYVTRASWKAFQHRYPTKTFEEFWEFCCRYQSLHSYPLRYFMTMNDSSKIILVNLEVCETPLVKEELQIEEDLNHCFMYDMAKSRGGGTQMAVA